MRSPSDASSPWLHRFAWFTAAATLFLICSGGMVTSKNAGLAVPDWPTTFGYNMFAFPFSKWIGGIFFEHVHRLIASTVGLLTIILAVWLWRAETRQWMRQLGYAAVGAVVLQGILGGLRVTLLKDQIGIFHACFAQAFFGLLVFIALAVSPFWFRLAVASRVHVHGLTSWALATSCLVYLQLGLGATMRHQHRDLAIPDFPAAYGQFIPDTSPAALAPINARRDALALSDVTAGQIWLQMAHRFTAVLIAIGIVTFWFRARGRTHEAPGLPRLANFWCILVFVQITLGASTIWSNKAADIATAHVAVGATILAIGVAVTAICFRLAYQERIAPPAPRSLISAGEAS